MQWSKLCLHSSIIACSLHTHTHLGLILNYWCRIQCACFVAIGSRWLEAWVLAWLPFCLRVPWHIWSSSSLRLARPVCRSIMKTSTLLFRNCGRLLKKDSGRFCWAVMRLRKNTCCKSAKYSRVLQGFPDAGHVSDGLCVQISWHLHVPYQQCKFRPYLF